MCKNGYFLDVLERVWEYMEIIGYLDPEINDYVGPFKQKEAVEVLKCNLEILNESQIVSVEGIL